MAQVLNPYAFVGDLHNQGADFIAQNLLSFDSLPSGVQMLINLSATFVHSTGEFPGLTYNDLVEAITLAHNNIVSDQFPSDYTPEQIAFAHQVEAVFDSYEDPFQHIAEINENIDNLVGTVLSSQISEQEQNPLLAGLAVGKSSLYYWNQQMADGNSYWSQVIDKHAETTEKAPTIDWRKVGKADIKGAVRGFFTGLFSGNALGGAAGGAIGSSVVELIDQLL